MSNTQKGMETRYIGADLRALRKSRNVTLSEMAHGLGKSVGWLSQIERDISVPDLDDLNQISEFLETPVSLFFGKPIAEENEEGKIVRSDTRRSLSWFKPGLSEELLSPDLTDDFEMLHSEFAPGSQIKDFVQRATTEVAYVISGNLDLWIGSEKFTLNEGDSFRIKGDPYRWENPYDTPCTTIWVISPPVY